MSNFDIDKIECINNIKNKKKKVISTTFDEI